MVVPLVGRSPQTAGFRGYKKGSQRSIPSLMSHDGIFTHKEWERHLLVGFFCLGCHNNLGGFWCHVFQIWMVGRRHHFLLHFQVETCLGLAIPSPNPFLQFIRLWEPTQMLFSQVSFNLRNSLHCVSFGASNFTIVFPAPESKKALYDFLGQGKILVFSS